MEIDPFSRLYSLYMALLDFKGSFDFVVDLIPDVYIIIFKIIWTGIGGAILWRGTIFYRSRVRVEKRRIRLHRNGLQKIHSEKWLGLARDFIQQSAVIFITGVISLATPPPVRPQLTFQVIVSSAAIIFIAYKSYHMVQRVWQADIDAVNYHKDIDPTIEEVFIYKEDE